MHVYLTQMNRAQLVTAYNNLTGESVNKFESHKVGCRRLTAAVEQIYDGAKGGEGIIYMPGDVQFNEESLTFTEVSAALKSKPVAEVKTRRRKPGVIAAIMAELEKNPDAGVDHILPILVQKFPKRDPKSMTTTIHINRSVFKKKHAS